MTQQAEHSLIYIVSTHSKSIATRSVDECLNLASEISFDSGYTVNVNLETDLGQDLGVVFTAEHGVVRNIDGMVLS